MPHNRVSFSATGPGETGGLTKVLPESTVEENGAPVVEDADADIDASDIQGDGANEVPAADVPVHVMAENSSSGDLDVSRAAMEFAAKLEMLRKYISGAENLDPCGSRTLI